ncbi:hypothetical protein [Nocardia iowensis]|uniref:Uncharacterized protein n=1 Tax=Nocardia iowensis TaxID=204891 RepID=A0ABX8RXK1_NOCIO|nr:hypothetical protein [Nocardia iowensis]QXN93095.1 hypothetical protein KV110_08310 [Nocardia iowensis]
MHAQAAKALARLADQPAHDHDHDPVLDEKSIAERTPVATFLARAVPEAQLPLTTLAERTVGRPLSQARKS